MSLQGRAVITCKKCGRDQEFERWKSVNVELNPELKDMLKKCSIFKVKCEECGEEYIVDYSVLYHDPKNKFMIQYLPMTASQEEIDAFEREKEGIFESLAEFAKMGYNLRITRTFGNLISKINTFENGLNDLPVEFLKNIIYSRAPVEKRELMVDIIFDGIDIENNKLKFILVYSDRSTLMGTLPKDTYDTANKLKFIEPDYYSEVTMNNVFEYIMKEDEPMGTDSLAQGKE